MSGDRSPVDALASNFNCASRIAPVTPCPGFSFISLMVRTTRRAAIWSFTSQWVTSNDRAFAKKKDRARPERLSPAPPPGPPELQADRITKFASRSRPSRRDAPSKAPFASGAPGGGEVTIAASVWQFRSVGSSAWAAKCRIL